MRTLPTTLVAIGLALAGCSGGTGGDDGGDVGDDVVLAYLLDCSISNWDEPCSAHASPNESPSKTEIDLVVNPLDPGNVFVAAKDNDLLASDNCVWAIGQSTTDGGATWQTTYLGGKLSERAPGDLLYGWRCTTDPIMTFNRDGDLYYALQTYEYDPVGLPVLDLPVGAVPPDGGIQVLAVSHDGGKTFPKDEMVLMHVGDSGSLVFHDYMRMGTNPQTGTVFTIWNQITGGATSIPVVVAYEPGSPVARPPVQLATPGSPLGTGESGIVADNDGTVYAFLGGFNSPDVAYIASSTDDGRTFSVPEEAFPFTPMGQLDNVSFRHGTAVEIAVDNSGGAHDGCLHTAWADGGATPDDTGQVLHRTSCDGGATWSEPAFVGNDTSGRGQFFPRVAVDGHGVVHVVYLTQAYDETGLVDAEWAYSMDDGATWTTQRLTATSFDGDLGIHQNGGPFLGDYIGIGAVGDHVWMGYPECGTGVCEIAVSHAVRNPDVADGHQH